MSKYRNGYWLHDPQGLTIILSAFELLIKDDVFARKEEGGWQEVILIGLLFVVLLIKSSFVLFEIFVEHIFAT